MQEVVHGSDGPNAVIATALHELLPEKRRKVLAFADSRQEAAFFAWYAEDSYRKLRDRNLLYRALTRDVVGSEGLSIDDIASRLQVEWEQAGLFRASDTREARRRQILTSVLREIVTDERRLSLAGVGLVRWMVALPDDLPLPGCLFEVPWNLRERDAMALLQYCLSLFLERRALELPRRGATLPWSDLSPIPKTAFGLGKPGGRRNVAQWGGPGSGLVRHYLARTLNGARRAPSQALEAARSAAAAIWTAFRSVRSGPFLVRAEKDGTFRLNSEWLRLHPARPGEVWACNTCTSLTPHNVRGVCPRNGCAGTLEAVVPDALPDNHYRSLYRSEDLPPALRSEEHTAHLVPRFGFVTPMFRDPKPPRRRAHRVYSTRPFFHGFVEVGAERPRDRCGLRVSSASSGTLVVLCEGRGGRGFLVCRSCGAHLAKRAARHRSPSDRECRGTLEQFSLGHELVTDVVRMEFPGLRDQWAAYSVAYAVLLGAADAIGVPQNDLNVTIAAGTEPDAAAVVLYDNVPGGAGLVTQLDDDGVLGRVLEGSRRRVEGGCGCGVSCYGCLRSYRNQFAHHRLDRKAALAVLARAVGAPTSSGPTVSSGR